MKALIIDNVPSVIADDLSRYGVIVETEIMPGAERLKKIIRDCDILIMRVIPPIDRDILDAAQNLKLIAVCSVGTTHIDLQYAREKGIDIINAPGANANAVAELTISKMLDLSRETFIAHREIVSQRIWEKYHFLGHELRGKKLGILGFGQIGRRVGEIARVIGMDILAYDPYLDEEFCKNNGAQKAELPELLKQADYVTIHLPLNKETENLISFNEIAQMKDGAVLINMGRGGIMNEFAAAQALQSGKLSGVGMDVIKAELGDLTGEDKVDSPLLQIDGNYVLSPHIGARTEEAQEAIGRMVRDKIVDYFKLGQ